MKHISFYIIAIITTVMALAPASALADYAKSTKVESNRDERNAIRKGNKLFEEKRYAEAEVEYKRALQHNPQSDVANYNLALSYIRQGGSSDPNDSKSPLNQADQILRNVVKTADKGLASRAYYNLGNLAFNKQNYQESVNMYKDALRRNPDDDQARENLRLAQKKLEEQPASGAEPGHERWQRTANSEGDARCRKDHSAEGECRKDARGAAEPAPHRATVVV